MNAKRKSITSDLKKLANLTDAEIDYSDSPPLDDSFFSREIIHPPKNKQSITLRLDHEVLEFFKERGKGYQTLMNAVLKTYALAHRKKAKPNRR